jgi:hypothetical protein
MRLLIIFGLTLLSIKCISQKRWAHVSIDSSGIKLTGIINDKGELIVPTRFQTILGDNGFYFVRKNELWGCYDNRGNNIIPVVYEGIGPRISEGLARVKKTGKWGFVDLSNKIIIDFKYAFACNFESGKAYVNNDLFAGYINKKGETIEKTSKKNTFCSENLSPDVEIRNQFRDSLLVIRANNGKFGVVESKTNKIIIPFQFDEIGNYNLGTILVRLGNKWGAYFDSGILITEPMYQSIGIFWDN